MYTSSQRVIPTTVKGFSLLKHHQDGNLSSQPITQKSLTLLLQISHGLKGRTAKDLNQVDERALASLFLETPFLTFVYHNLLHPGNMSNLSAFRVKDPRQSKQLRRTFVNGFLQWLLTLGLVLCEFAVLYGFSRQPTVSKAEKYSFNAAITLLSLALSLAVVAALKSYCKLLSWRLLASKYRDLQEFELIMNCDSQSKVLKLLWASRTSGRFRLSKTQILCIVSFFVFIGLQICIGLLGLTYSIDASQNVDHIYGNVSVVDLSNIYQDPSYNTAGYVDRTAAANYFGLVGQNYPIQYNWPLGKGDEGFENIYTADNSTFFYNFVDAAVDVNANNPVFDTSRRWIAANATCVELEIISGGYIKTDGSDQWLSYKNVLGNNQTIYVQSQTTLTSTYMSNSSNSGCGDRCTSMLVLDSASYDNDTQSEAVPHLLTCNTTIDVVHNANTCTRARDCTLEDDLARIIAGGIGWSGTWFTDGNPLQYRTYPPGSPYSWDGYEAYQDPSFRAWQVATFAIDVIAAMDDLGPRKVVEGQAPKAGVALEVEWRYTIPLLCVVPTVQFIILLIVCIWSNGALIKDGSYLAAAHLLRPVVEKLEDHGCALTGDEIAREWDNFKIIYGVKAPPGIRHLSAYAPTGGSQVDWHVGVIAESEGYGQQAEEGWKPAATFPDGRYDGTGYTLTSKTTDDSSLQDDSTDEIDEDAYLLST
ncbi:hypothetical protein LTR51_008378 [Lithohypha guttulata]|nr:hypothetical protein LTR51_008378 [Lithohypha guttulata]